MSVLINEQDYELLCATKKQLALRQAAEAARERKIKEAEAKTKEAIESRYNRILDDLNFCGICELVYYSDVNMIHYLIQWPMQRPRNTAFIGLRYTIPSEERLLQEEIRCSLRYCRIFDRVDIRETYIVVQNPTHYDELIQRGYRIPIEVRDKLQKEIDDEIARKKAKRRKELEVAIHDAEVRLKELPTLIAAYKRELETL